MDRTLGTKDNMPPMPSDCRKERRPIRRWAALWSLVLVMTCASPTWAWGPGHDDLARLALEKLPAPLRQLLGPANAQKLVQWAHGPDDQTPWETLQTPTILPADLAILKRYGRANPASLHDHRGQAVNFILLCHALREQDPARSAWWSACILHTMADEAACNHDPLIHYITYGFAGGYGMKMGKGVGLDFADVMGSTDGQAMVQELVKAVQGHVLAEDSQQAMLRVMLAGLESNAYMTQRGSTIAAAQAAGADGAVRHLSQRAMAELGVFGLERGLDAIVTALKLAEAGRMPELTPQIEQEYARRKQQFIHDRPLACDSLFADFLAGPKSDGPTIGVLVEPSISMNEGQLGFGSKLVSAAILRTLGSAGLACRPVDLRTLEAQPLGGPEVLPLLIVCAGPFRVSPQVKDHLRQYVVAGGKLLWIGGEHGGVLGELSGQMRPVEDARLPVTRKYGQNNRATIGQLSIRFDGAMCQALGERPYRFVHNPDTPAGWQKPFCGYSIAAAPAVRALASLQGTDAALAVAAAVEDPTGQTRHVFLPEYLVAPYALSEQTTIQDPSRPALDDVGQKVMLTAVKLLMPAGSGAHR
jgi:hypothetical protein